MDNMSVSVLQILIHKDPNNSLDPTIRIRPIVF